MTNTLTPLSAISPVDGRYRRATEPLAAYFSEQALIRHRAMVEVEYFIALCEIPLPQLARFPHDRYAPLRQIIADFSDEDALRVKAIEKETNHDVKAVEYFLKEAFDRLGTGAFSEFIHFGLTSQDVTNTAAPLCLKAAWENILKPGLESILEWMKAMAHEWRDVVMLARTHGQPASPTSMGKEIFVFADRLTGQLALTEHIPFAAKFGGATGNFNAHYAAYPEIDWIGFADRFVNRTLGLKRSAVTTQIEPYDHLGALFDNLKRINTILIDFCRDIWTYIAFDYFKQKIKAGEVGSSTMPNKVNPIDFENAEGNFGVANALFEHLSAKLPISRMQRDLTDSTVMRNIGVPIGHTLIGIKSVQRGCGKLILNATAIDNDLDNQWAVVAEGIQTILRREGYPKPYEALKALTRTHARIDRKTLAAFIDGLDLSQEIKRELKAITPKTYTGRYNY
ncbi:MAG: adenylosuccinate lyase [Deltaproteobacteria bacterium]|nr:adenylosuccinate lyase [Deltaproteobacteria bacterium]